MFSATNLPRLKPNSGGHAFPAHGAEVVACEVPGRADFPLPASWGGGTKTVDVGQGYWITGLTPDDVYPNNEFTTFYKLGNEVDPADDERARIIHGFWKNLGYDVKLYRATKTKPAIVVGVVDEAGQFMTAEGLVNINPGDVLLESPIKRGQMWRLEPGVFAKKYDSQGIRPGLLPNQ